MAGAVQVSSASTSYAIGIVIYETLYWSDLSFDAVSPEIPYKLNIRQFVCTILSINKTRAEEDVRIRADSWRVCLFLL